MTSNNPTTAEAAPISASPVCLARLGAETTSVLSYAAVIGEEFDAEVLAGATGVAEDRLLDLLEEVGRTALIHEVGGNVGRFRFKHAIVQHTLYLDTSPSRRSRAHAQIAASMAVLERGEPGVLAHHYLAGITPRTTMAAIQQARAAAEHAMLVAAPAEAGPFPREDSPSSAGWMPK